jgi:capsular exopolysaccharide synthesis family protein
VRDHWWLVVACVVLTTAIAAIYVVTAPKKYKAQAEVLVSAAPDTDSTLFGLPVLHATADPTRDVLTAASLITTTDVANATISALHLNEGPGWVLQRVQANPIGQSNLIGVQATGSSARQAQLLANTVAAQAIAVRTAAMHQAIANIIPGLRAQVAALPPSERNGPGTLGDQLSQLEQLQHSNDPTLVIASPAELPTGPYSPRTKLALLAGVLGGLILGIGAAFAWSALDPRVKREEQLRDLIRSPVLARIPTVRTKTRPRPLTPEELPVPALEGYRTLRTILAVRAEGRPQAYLVTGSSPSEGKTTSAMGLALALAQGGARVILIEADLRRPTFSTALGLTPTYGTDQVLVGEVPLDDALIEVRIDGTPLQVLASHRSGVELADRLSSSVARRLIDSAKERADFVVIDSPPMTTVIDALPLAQFADEIIVVVRLGHTRLNKLRELDDLFRAHGTYPAGLVVVGANRPDGYGHYYTEQGDQPIGRQRQLNGGERERERARSPRSAP